MKNPNFMIIPLMTLAVVLMAGAAFMLGKQQALIDAWPASAFPSNEQPK